jgi:hypothetical protein
VNTTCGVYTVRLRTDLPRDVACSYWAGPHADIVRRLPRVVEYNQHLFSATDHGFWPATTTVGTIVPSSWRTDGLAEVRFENMLAVLRAPVRLRGILLDEQNVFEQVLGHLTRPGYGRWWTAGHDPTVGQRAVLLLRRRRGVSGRAFRVFVHERLGPALAAGGARDLRATPSCPRWRFRTRLPACPTTTRRTAATTPSCSSAPVPAPRSTTSSGRRRSPA